MPCYRYSVHPFSNKSLSIPCISIRNKEIVAKQPFYGACMACIHCRCINILNRNDKKWDYEHEKYDWFAGLDILASTIVSWHAIPPRFQFQFQYQLTFLWLTSFISLNSLYARLACVTFWNGLDSFLMATFCCVTVSYAALKVEKGKRNKKKNRKFIIVSSFYSSEQLSIIFVVVVMHINKAPV